MRVFTDMNIKITALKSLEPGGHFAIFFIENGYTVQKL